MHTVSTLNRFWCLRAQREGKPVPRWIQTEAQWTEGLVRMREERDDVLGRHVLVARMLGVGRDVEKIPPLIDAKIILLDDERLVLTGIERDETTRKSAPQTWLLVKGREEPKGAGLQAGG